MKTKNQMVQKINFVKTGFTRWTPQVLACSSVLLAILAIFSESELMNKSSLTSKELLFFSFFVFQNQLLGWSWYNYHINCSINVYFLVVSSYTLYSYVVL